MDVEDHQGAIIITKSAGNVVKAMVVSKVANRVLQYPANGVYYPHAKKLILAPENEDTKSLGIVCTFSHENSAECKLMKDSFSTMCGSFNIQRDYTGSVLSFCLI